jgi:uncharacterized protein YecE (DUF72 family)
VLHTPSSPTYSASNPISAEEKSLYGSFRSADRVALAWERTQEAARILDAGVIVFHCPASFLPARENIRNFGSFIAPCGRRLM